MSSVIAIVALAAMLSLFVMPASNAVAVDVAILQSSDIAAYSEAVAGFKAAGIMGAIFTEYDLQGDLALGRKIARKVRASDTALVVAVGLKAALAAKLELPDIPIVYMMILDPLKHELTAPNMTGTMLEVPTERQLKILRSFLPSSRRLGMLYNPGKSGSKLKEEVQEGRTNSFEVHGYPVESERDVPQQLRLLLGENDALWLIPDSTVLTNESVRFILDTSLERRVPVIGFSPEFTRLGAFLSISTSYTQVGRETAALAKRILNKDVLLPLPPVPIERVKITVNLKTAKFLNIPISKELNTIIDETH